MNRILAQLRITRLLIFSIITAALFVCESVTPSEEVPAGTESAALRQNPVNTYLLIHGAWHPEACWDQVKEKLEKKVISLPSVTSKNQIADILMKAVRIEVFEETLCKLGVQDLPLNLRGSVENNG